MTANPRHAGEGWQRSLAVARSLGVSASKLLPPAPPDDTHEIDQDLVEGVVRGLPRQPLTVVTAPAGAGKSTLLSAVAARVDRPVAWIRVDAADDNAEHFARLLGAAIHAAAPALTPSLSELLDAPAAVPMAVPMLATNDLLAQPGCGLVVVLDDVHVLADSSVLAVLSALVRDAPPNLAVLLGGRALPDLGIGRGMATGQVRVVGPTDLRMTGTTAVAVLRRLGADVSGMDTGAVANATAGLPALVRLYGEALRVGGSLPGGTPDLIYTFMAEELLAHLDDADRDLLLRVSVLDHITPERAQALTGRPDAGGVLHHLHTRHHFLLRDAGPGERYRLHDLFADFLDQHLSRWDADARSDVHRRAAEVVDDVDPRIGHLVAAGERTRAVEVLGEALREQVMQPAHVHRLSAWADRLDEGVPDPWLDLARGASAFFRHDEAAAIPLLDRARTAIDAGDHPTAYWAAVYMRHRMRVEDLPLHPPDRTTVGDRPPGLDDLRDDMANVLDDPTRLPPVLRRALREGRGMTAFYRRDLDTAARELSRIVREGDYGATIHLYVPGVGRVAREHTPRPARTDTEAVWRHGWLRTLDHVLGSDPQQPEPTVPRMVLGHLPPTFWMEQTFVDCGWHAQRGSWEEVLAAVDRQQAMFANDPWFEGLRTFGLVALARPLRLLRRHGDLVDLQARDDAEPLTRMPDHREALRATIDAEVAWADGDRERAAERFGRAAELWRIAPMHGPVGLPHLSRAAVLLEQGRTRDARAAAVVALDIVDRDGLVGVAAQGGPVLIPVLRDMVEAGLQVGAADAVLRILGAAGGRSRRNTDSPLSDRESQVLDLLASGATNAEIAARLVVSANTVKTHVRNVLRKLDADSRTRAVANARNRGLL